MLVALFNLRVRRCLLAALFYLPAMAIGAQETTQPPATEEPIPSTRVEATPLVTNFFPQDYSGLTGTILDGTIFSNAPTFGYRAETSTTGSIIAIPDANMPATVSTITRDVLDDQIILNFTDLLRDAGGLAPVGDAQFADQLLIRGQQIGTRNFRKDGFLDPTLVPRDFQNVERVEILKGPASMLYGAVDPAGLVNVITKTPIANTPFANFGFTFGAYSQARYTLDMNGQATQSGNVLYRMNVAQEDVNSFVNYVSTNRTQISPVVTWLIDPSTTLTWNGEWHRDDRTGFQGTPALGGNALALPPSRFVGEPANDFFNSQEFRQSLILTHELSDNWVFRIGGNSLFFDFPNSSTAATNNLGFLPPAPEPFFYRLRSDGPINEGQSQSMIANLAGEFWTGDWNHKAVAGVEYNYLDSQSIFNANTPLTLVPFPPFAFPQAFDVSNPDYTNPPAGFLFGLETQTFQQQRVGGYMQDLIEFTPHWKGLAGVRFDTVNLTFNRIVSTANPNPALPPIDTPLATEQNFNRVSPRTGLIYQPFADETLSYYYSYAQSFTPPGGGAYFDATPLKAILGDSHEAGIKALILPNLSLTACGFHITRENDLFNLNPSLLTQVGEVRSQGAELNLLGAITDNWNMLANYTYTDTLVTDIDPLINGRRARNVPFNTANLWTRYNLYNDGYKVYGAALGLVYLGNRFAALSAPNPAFAETADVHLPSFTRWDAGLYYRRGQFNTNVYLENLFDVQYAQSSVNQYQIFQGAPLNVRASISYLY